jgi:hypothetical protein
VLGAVVSGIGVLGFLTFVGGWVALARFRGEGLSGVVGVSLVPRGQLLASGADQLFAPFVLAVAVMVGGAVYLLLARQIQPHGPRLARGFGPYTVWFASRARIVPLIVLAVLAIRHYEHTTGHHGISNTEDFGTALDAVILVFLISIPLAYWFAGRAAARPTARVSREDLAYLAVLGGAALAFGSLQTIAANEWNPPIQPIAIVRKSLPAVTGIYVGEDSTRVYVGVIASHLNLKNANSQLSTRLVTVNRADILGIERGNTGLRIGGLRDTAHRDPTALTASQLGLIEDLLLPNPPTLRELHKSLGIPIIRANLVSYYASHEGHYQPAIQRACVESVFGTDVSSPSTSVVPGYGEIDLSTVTLADFLYLLRQDSETARQVLGELQTACAVDGKPALA